MGQVRRISIAVTVSCALATAIATARGDETTFAVDSPPEATSTSTTRVEAVGPLSAKISPPVDPVEPVASSPPPTAAPITPPTGPTPTTRGGATPAPRATAAPPSRSRPADGRLADTKNGVGPDAAGAYQRPGKSETRLLELLNGEREDAGCAPLLVDEALSRAAKEHSSDMARQSYFSNNGPDGRGPAERARDAGYTGETAENIAKDATNATKVLASWLSEPSAKANIMSCTTTTVGIGVARSRAGITYWTADFGTE